MSAAAYVSHWDGKPMELGSAEQQILQLLASSAASNGIVWQMHNAAENQRRGEQAFAAGRCPES